jgi:hypothetical protein
MSFNVLKPSSGTPDTWLATTRGHTADGIPAAVHRRVNRPANKFVGSGHFRCGKPAPSALAEMALTALQEGAYRPRYSSNWTFTGQVTVELDMYPWTLHFLQVPRRHRSKA